MTASSIIADTEGPTMELNRKERQTLAQWFTRPWQEREVALGALASRLHRDYGFGELIGDGRARARLQISRDHLSALRDELKRDGLGDPCQPEFVTEAQSRNHLAQTRQDEKRGARAVGDDLVLCRPLGHWHIDGQPIPLPPFEQAGQLLNWRSLSDMAPRLCHSHLVLVENLALMPELHRLALPRSLNNPLFLYRGDADRSTGAAYRCFRAFKGRLPLVYFGDFDPAGLEIGLGCGAERLLLPAPDCWETLLHPHWQSLTGAERRWYAQEAQARRLFSRNLAEPLKQALLAMDSHKQTRTQEHLLAHGVELELVDL
ncbi:hypothetical protein FCL40_14765 [Ferrimonas sediminicola]|uniref:DUF7281 domain-containing protein n=1 Tax=Ferrimonas sediminicola TaxID=2569538 RepID=A0A4U1BA90_9GAMM|nr:hypothetical protein [Ferrimonas sediminicola]TKB47736.1 hypothetical protein FCL40_14765 [Ferrimonas sediminicola]